MLFGQLSNYRLLQDVKLALRRDIFAMECCERLLHRNKLSALRAHQITCLLSINGLNYRGRQCQLHARWSHMDRGRVRPHSLWLCVMCYRLLLLLLQVSVTSHEVLWVSIGSGASWQGLVVGWLREVPQCLPLKAKTFISFWMGSESSLDIENTGLFISPSGISELDCATTKTDTAERSISIGRKSLQVFFVLGALAYFQVPPLGGSRDEKWRSQWIRKAHRPGRPVRFAAHRQPLCRNSCTIHELFCL